jgi:hypothetical protein
MKYERILYNIFAINRMSGPEKIGNYSFHTNDCVFYNYDFHQIVNKKYQIIDSHHPVFGEESNDYVFKYNDNFKIISLPP